MTVAELRFALLSLPNTDEVAIRIEDTIVRPTLVYRQELLDKKTPRIVTVIR